MIPKRFGAAAAEPALAMPANFQRLHHPLFLLTTGKMPKSLDAGFTISGIR